jgi:hypothetical protein
LHRDIEYFLYPASWASAVKRFLMLTTTSDGRSVAVLTDELGSRTALFEGFPATVGEATSLLRVTWRT